MKKTYILLLATLLILAYACDDAKVDPDALSEGAKSSVDEPIQIVYNPNTDAGAQPILGNEAEVRLGTKCQGELSEVTHIRQVPGCALQARIVFHSSADQVYQCYFGEQKETVTNDPYTLDYCDYINTLLKYKGSSLERNCRAYGDMPTWVDENGFHVQGPDVSSVLMFADGETVEVCLRQNPKAKYFDGAVCPDSLVVPQGTNYACIPGTSSDDVISRLEENGGGSHTFDSAKAMVEGKACPESLYPAPDLDSDGCIDLCPTGRWYTTYSAETPTTGCTDMLLNPHLPYPKEGPRCIPDGEVNGGTCAGDACLDHDCCGNLDEAPCVCKCRGGEINIAAGTGCICSSQP